MAQFPLHNHTKEEKHHKGMKIEAHTVSREIMGDEKSLKGRFIPLLRCTGSLGLLANTRYR